MSIFWDEVVYNSNALLTVNSLASLILCYNFVLLSLELPIALVDEKGRLLKGHSLSIVEQQKTITFATLFLFSCYKWMEEMLLLLTDFEMGAGSKMIWWFAALLDAIVIAATHSVVHCNISHELEIELLINWFIINTIPPLW